MKISIDKVSKLARLALSEDEKATFGNQLDSVLEYMDTLNGLDTAGVDPTSHVLAISNVFREDVAVGCLPRQEALRNAPDPTEEFYRVPRIIE